MSSIKKARLLKYKISHKKSTSYVFPRISRIEAEIMKERAGKSDKEQIVLSLKPDKPPARPSSNRKNVVVGYCAIKNLKELTKRMMHDKEKFSTCLNEFIAVVDDVVLNERGMTEKFDGKGILYYIDPDRVTEGDLVAPVIIAALKLRYRMNKMNRAWDFYRNDAWIIQIGIDAGWAIIEEIETPETIQCTVKGNVARMARGIGQKAGKTQILISENVYKFPKFKKSLFQIKEPYHVQPEGADFMTRVREIVAMVRE